MPTGGWWEALFPDPAAIVAALGVQPGVTVVDLCCGNGWFTLPMAAIAKRVFAVDIDTALLDDCRARLDERGVTNVDIIFGDAYDIARLAPAPADIVVMANCFHGVPDKTRLAREVSAALTPRRPLRDPQLASETARGDAGARRTAGARHRAAHDA